MITAENIEESLEELMREADAALLKQDLPEASRLLKLAANLDPHQGRIWLNLGHLYFGQDKYAEALQYYGRANELEFQPAETHAACSLACYLLGQSQQAEAYASDTLQRDPFNVVALKVTARLHIDRQQFEEARRLCRRILEQDPEDAEAVGLLGQCRFDVGTFASELPELPQVDSLTLDDLSLDGSEGSAQATPTPSPSPAPASPPPPVVPVTPVQGGKLDGLLGNYQQRSQTWSKLGSEHVLRQLVCHPGSEPIVLRDKTDAGPPAEDGFPVPPEELTMGYGAGDLDHYLACGRRSREILLSLLEKQGVTLECGDLVLDWGCAAGRVVRAFREESDAGVQIWGCDVDQPAVAWAQDHLSPPFQFFNCTSLPHLPFADNTFKVIYGLSVFTHLVVFRDMWLLELARVMQPGGTAILTIHDEHCWQAFTSGDHPAPGWLPEHLRSHKTLPSECVEIRGSRWDECYTFFHSDYIRRVWGRFLEVLDIQPQADSYQAAVLLKKP